MPRHGKRRPRRVDHSTAGTTTMNVSLGQRGASTAWSRIIWPDQATPGPLVWDPWSALAIPGVARAVSIYTGSMKQAPMDAYRGDTPLPRPRLLDQPDPTQSRPWFVQSQVDDYFLNGNAVSYVTSFDTTGWPATVTWIPAAWLQIACEQHRYDNPTYLMDGIELDRRRIVHVKRSWDRWCPARGVGVVEQHLTTLDRVASEEAYERDALKNGAVPSVAVITPNPGIGEDEAKQAKVEWLAKFGGPKREPAILPAGTQVIPLAWSPEDAQLVAARQMSLLDVANAFNLDGYWTGAPGGSMTYRSPGAMYTNLLRVSLEPVLVDFEAVWGMAWLPRGQSLKFNRLVLTRDDFQTTVQTLVTATSGDKPLMTVGEARAFLQLPPELPAETAPPPAPQPESE